VPVPSRYPGPDPERNRETEVPDERPRFPLFPSARTVTFRPVHADGTVLYS